MFRGTHGFLPERSGIRPNTLHVILHLVTLTTLFVLGAVTALGRPELRISGTNSHFPESANDTYQTVCTLRLRGILRDGW
jgi:hypothetical protein